MQEPLEGISFNFAFLSTWMCKIAEYVKQENNAPRLVITKFYSSLL